MGLFRKGRRFPCPFCTKEVIAESSGHGAWKLKHKCPGGPPKDITPVTYRSLMLSAFVSYCKPPNVYPRIEGVDDSGNILDHLRR